MEPKTISNKEEIKINIGCGNSKIEEWINIDIDPSCKPDLIAGALELEKFFEWRSVDEIDSYHMFEHLSYVDAIKALRSWSRLLKIGGLLHIEMPDLAMCAKMVLSGDKEKIKYGMMGLFGQYHDVNRPVSVFQYHRYGWTFEMLKKELEENGFIDINCVPVKQFWREAHVHGRDMRVSCMRGL